MGHRHQIMVVAVLFALAIFGLGMIGEPGFPQATPSQVPQDLGGADRALAHLSTDKPVYRPGEKVFARAVLLDAFSRKPSAKAAWASFEVRSARGERVVQLGSTAQDSVAPFGWEIPLGTSGGTYTLVARFPQEGTPDAELTFDIRGYRTPRLRTDLQFLKKAFGPGDDVVAALSATRAEGGIPAGAKVTAVATVDGAEVHRSSVALDALGLVSVGFRLPAVIQTGNGTLSMIIEDGGVQETAAKLIPIVVNRVSLAFFPEGGDLVGGVPSRVYFEARTPRQDPADVAGRILDEAGKEVARFESVHEGRGRLEFTPAVDGRYRAVIDRPSGILDPVALPELQGGFSLSALDEITASERPVRVRVASPVPAGVTVGLYIKERELAREAVKLEAGKPLDVSLASKDAAGVLRVTVFDGDGKPRAERLIFRAPANELHVEVKVDRARTVPSGKVNVTVRTTDAAGKPVRAVVGLSAVDDAVLETIDPRDRAPRLPVQALLGSEVKELKDARVYLSGDPLAALRTDLLLGTQGWRRFGFAEPSTFVAASGMPAKRALALRVPVPIEFEGADRPRGGARFGAKGAPPVPPQAAVLRAPLAEEKPAWVAEPPAAPPPPKEDAAGDAKNHEFAKVEQAGKALRFANRFDRDVMTAPAWVRIYAHDPAPGRVEGARTDFTETVYWHAGIATNEKGEATVSFAVSDSITTVRVRADGFSTEGALGEADETVEVRRPFYVEPKCPLEVTAGDRIDLPVTLVNGTDSVLGGTVEASVGQGIRHLEGGTWSSDVAGGKSVRGIFPLLVQPHQGDVELRLVGTAGVYKDDVTRRIAVVPAGFPIEMNYGGLLEAVVRHELSIPEGIEPSSLATQASVYPSPLASLTQALAALLREPGGCFEQTSSSNYPNVMALQYLKGHSGVDPELVRRASDLVERGYKRLVSFECPKKGYEWFGSDPGHEALTAYGIMEFIDMSRVMNVDMGMIERTRQWLLSRRDNKGGFLRDAKALDTFGGAPPEITDAYVLWGLTEAGEKGLEKEIAALKEAVSKSEDPYLMALSANVLFNAGDRATAVGLLDRLATKQAADGSLPGAKTSITRSGGECLEIETVSFAVLGWLRSPKHTANSEKAMRWLLERCKSGRFGATQSTILALKAIIAYDTAHARPKRAGKIILSIDGKETQTVAFPANQEGPIVLADFSSALKAGKHAVEIKMEGGADMPYSLQVRYHARTPSSSDKCQVGIRTSLAKDRVVEGEAVDMSVEVTNRTKEGLPMVTAIVGLPGGLEARAEQLKELVREGKVDAFETRGREVILYWRGMAPGAKKVLFVSCIAAVAGEYTGPASRAYLYYTDEHKDWQPGLRVTIPRRG